MEGIRSRLPESPEWRLKRTKLPVVGFEFSLGLNRLWRVLIWRLGELRGWSAEHEDCQIHERCPYCRWGGPPLYQITVHADWKSASAEELRMASEAAAMGAMSAVDAHFPKLEDVLTRAREEGRLWSRRRATGLEPPHHYTEIARLDPEPYDPEYFFAPEGEWIEMAVLGSEESHVMGPYRQYEGK